jgi:hypothetical protein
MKIRWVALVVVLLAAPGWPAENVLQQMRQIEAALGRITQEQQAVYQQFQMVQELRRNEERQLLPMQTYSLGPTPRNYEDVKREEETRALRVRELQYELDRLYTRYRELEDQKRPLLDTLSALAQQRAQEPAPQRPAAEQSPAAAGR